MGILREIGIVSGTLGKSEQVFDMLTEEEEEIAYEKPSEYVQKLWQKYSELNTGNNNLNGTVFEYILAVILHHEKITPFFIQAKVAFVPNVHFDIMTYSKERGPICLSAKTSLRERYKQADLEAIALKNVHRRSLCFLITLDEREANSVRKKIEIGDVSGLDDVVIATSPDFDKLIERLKQFSYENPKPVRVINATKMIGQQNRLF